MCGEKSMAAPSSGPSTGSPPHVRGKDGSEVVLDQRIGITPACAGKSYLPDSPECQIRDHPRMCGEKKIWSLVILEPVGSPPHVRGKATGVAMTFPRARITPACAGKRLKRSRSTVPHAAIVPLFPSVCNKPAGSDGSPAGHDAPPFLPIENAAPASPAYNLRSL